MDMRDIISAHASLDNMRQNMGKDGSGRFGIIRSCEVHSHPRNCKSLDILSA